MADKEFLDILVPIELENGKTIWSKIGTAFPNHDPDKRHRMVLSITSMPLSAFTKEELKVYIFPQRKYEPKRPNEYRSDTSIRDDVPPPYGDDDVPF